jgi:beta-ribofuranosylaminobenzene 5'-phosphate synthase
MHEGAPRINGGIGFALDGPMSKIVVRDAAQLVIYDDRPRPMSRNELAQHVKMLELFAMNHGLKRLAEFRISGEMGTHVGMGSATAIRLGTIESLALLNGWQISKDQLVAASGRGGTSGIGVSTYFDGGLICDLGRTNEGQAFAPSSQVIPTRPPLTLPSITMPSWPMLLCVPRAIAPKTQQDEIAFFERTTPLAQAASFEATYVALFEIYAAAAESNYVGFCQGIVHMQQTVWKQAERQEYGDLLREITERLMDAGSDCVGMSSLGPMLFCFAKPERLSTITDVATVMDCDVHLTRPSNHGRKVTLLDA